MDDFVSEYSYLISYRTIADAFYSYIGGLYMIVDDTNKIYQCDDFSMEKEIIFFVKTILIKYPYLFSVIFFIILIICQQIKI
jgi:hypothetical protein